ncbi:MAG TPA: lmo0937 family membrane protein [Candidatus Eisenbacteria bacterium]|nr:lmo0937 family membrane protein [Candidatus Eisenbacteria bacterium]
MLRILGVLLLVLWLVGMLAFKTLGAIVHLFLVLAIVLFLVGLFRGRRAV